MAEPATLTTEQKKEKCLQVLAEAEKIKEGKVEGKKLEDAVNLLLELQPILNTLEQETSSVRFGAYNEMALNGMYLGKRAETFYVIAEYNSALEAFEQLSNALSGNSNIIKAKGDCYRKLKNYDKALEIYKNELDRLTSLGLKAAKLKGPVLNSKGLCYVAQEKWGLALDAFKEATEVEKENILYMCNYAKVLRRSEEGEEEALRIFKEAYELSKSEANAAKSKLTKNNLLYIRKTLGEIIEVDQLAQNVTNLVKGMSSGGGAKFRQVCLRLQTLKNQNALRAQKALGEPEEHLDAPALHKSDSVVSNIQDLKSLQQEIEEMKKTIATKADDFDKIIEQKISGLPKKSREKIMDFHDAFLSTISGVFTNAQVIEGGSFKFETGSSVGSLLSTLVSFVPIIGEKASQVVSTVDEFMSTVEIKSNARKMLKLSSDHSHLSQLISETSSKIVCGGKYQQKILTVTDKSLEPKITGTLSRIRNLISELSGQIDARLYGETYETPAAKLGNIEANNLIEKWLKNEVTKDSASLSAALLKDNIAWLDTSAESATLAPQPDSPEPVPVNRKAACCNIF